MSKASPLDWIVEHYCARASNDLPSFKLIKGLVECCEVNRHNGNPSLPLLLFTIRDNISEDQNDCNWDNMLEIVKYIQQIERLRRKLREHHMTEYEGDKKINRVPEDSTDLEILFEQSVCSLKRMMVLIEMKKAAFSSSNCMALINLLFPPNSRPFNKNQVDLGNFPLKHVPNPRTQLHTLLYQVDMAHLKSTGANRKRKASACFAENETITDSNLPELELTLSRTDWTKIYRSLNDFLVRAENEIQILDGILHPSSTGSKFTVLEKIVKHYMVSNTFADGEDQF